MCDHELSSFQDFSPSNLAVWDFLFPSFSVGVLSSFLRLSLPNFLYTYFHLSLRLRIRQTLSAPLWQYNEIESTQIERSHFYSCQLIIEEPDSSSTGGKMDGSDGGIGGFCWERVPGEVGQELFYTQNFFFPVSFFWYFCPLVQPWSFFFPSQ